MENQEQWLKIKEIVGAALEKAPGERAGFLDAACSGDPALRAEVESLLSAYREASPLSEPTWESQPVDAQPPGETVGPYRLIRELGFGGMGRVWLAEQTEPVRRLVALKLIRGGLYDALAVQRFQAERQSLAIMDHPAIAKVFDAGTTPAGQPYLAMEYVDGLPITAFCDRNRLGIRDRLALFLQVCDGVQHAHTKAIIHRDLKPTNILVTEVDGKPMPRIIDFGLAKAASPSTAVRSNLTQAGTFLGTPSYMSPEQADPDLRDIDTRTDVYSLGVLLYELLAGFLPLDTTQWRGQGLESVLRHLRLANLSSTLGEAHQYADAEKLTRESLVLRTRVLGPDHPNTLMSMNNLAWLLEQEGKTAEAEKLFREVGEIQRRVLGPEHPDTLRTMFNVATTLRREGRYDESERLHRSVLEVMRRVNGPEARETLGEMDELGLTLYFAGRYAEAEKLQRQLVEIMRRTLGPEHIDTVEATDNLASTLLVEGRDVEAKKLEDAMLAIRNRVLGPDHPMTAAALYTFACAHVRAGKRDEALSLLRNAVDHGLTPTDAAAMAEDSELKPLSGDPRFEELVAYAKKRAAYAKEN